MKTKSSQSIAEPKINYKLIILSTILVVFFGAIIVKNVSLPTGIVTAIGLLVLSVLLFLSFRNVIFVFYIMVAYLPFNKILVGNFGGFMQAVNLTNILMLLVFMGWLANSMLENKQLYKRTSLDIPVLIFCVLGLLSLLKGAYYFGGDYLFNYLINMKRWLTPMFLFFLASNVIKTKEKFKYVIIIMMIVVTVAGLMAMYDYLDYGINASSLEDGRVGGIAEQANMLGAFFVYYMFIMAGFLLVYWKSFKYWFLSIPFGICFVGIMVTFSRGAYLAFAFGCLALAFFKNKIIFLMVIILFIIAILNPAFLPQGMRYRMESTFSDKAVYATNVEDVVDASAQQRLTIWKGAIQMIKEHPWGVGYGMFFYLIPQYAPIYSNMDAHNTYLIIAAEMGIVTLAVFLWIILVLFKNCYWLYKRVEDKFFRATALGMLAGLAGFMVVNMFGSRLESEEVSSYFWILAGLMMRAVWMKRKGLIS